MKIIITIVLLAGVGGGIYYYLSQPRVMSSSAETVTQCSSPDARELYEKGVVSFLHIGDTGIPSTKTDTCDYFSEGKISEQGRLVQSFCSGDQLITEDINCGIDSACRQGRCVKGELASGGDLPNEPICIDSDGGKNIKERGEVEGIGFGSDDCYVSSDVANPGNSGGLTNKCIGAECYVYEYFCSGEASAYEVIPSPKGCENGSGK